ncbi:lecithin retinol acyltransferase family protein [Nostoc sp. FACHB-152]|uniref:lecithin retinol acyltransferase family protein n=1 Tax=unclassified Nostoc TaxID=2593658 RepID=UPI0016893127|nr:MULTISPECIES: lecithin retinol acyltransferase family protein [unclassified Nostoc]MBD2446587.1 lecithin retinol acyltransferase family protein [Nostoc sp. FACHB-152]MBD2466435.1 lecithin retinol acyltransferase family protein [Nostoc sp. FACHB-145]
MAKGDHIFVWCGNSIIPTHTHHGIDCGNGTVIHFAGNKNKKNTFVITKTSLVSFAAGNVKSQKEVYALNYDVLGIPYDLPDLVIQRAENFIGKGEYHLFENNCEHFAFFCKTGIKKSYQIEKLIEDGVQGRVASSAYMWSIGVLINNLFKASPQKYKKIRVA